MLVRVVRLFAGVVLLGCFVTVALFTELYGWRSGVIHWEEGYHPRFRAVDHVHTHRQFINSSAIAVVDHHILFQPLTADNYNSTNISQSAYVQSPSITTPPPIPQSANISSHSLTTSSTVTSHHTEIVDTSSNISSVPPATRSGTAHSESNMSSPQSLEKSSLHSNMSSALMSHQSLHKNMQGSPSPRLSKLTSATTIAHETSSTFLTATSATAQQDSHSQGYVLAVNYYEQQTMGLRNMMQLQCWAQSLKLKVVKPVMHDSFLRTPLDSARQAQFLKFEDSFDLQEWSQHAEKLGYAPLVEWSEFLAHAPRDVVLVLFEHPSVSMLKSRQKSGQGLLHSPDSLQFTSGCTSKWPTASELHFLKSNGFRVVHSACFNFFFGDQLSLETFNQHILSGHNPASVTVIMETWRGISSAQRVLLRDVCQNTALVQERLSLSRRLSQKADQYIHKYLGGNEYLAIMGRLEISQLTVHKKVPVVPFCLEETLSKWKDFKNEVHLERTFLAIDIGRYGSKKYRSRLDPGLETSFHKFFQTLFGTSLTKKEWEKRFELVAGNRDAGYIGLLQKVLVTRARCVLFVGGGAFQRHALHLYKHLHPDPKDQCYRIVKTCTRSNKLS